MTSLHTTNNMMRAIGLTVPQHDDRIFDPEFDHLSGYVEDTQPTVMDAAGWGDTVAVDEFFGLSDHDRMMYALGMGLDLDG